jgi:ABC-type dipeptide/oligopeptide/nickel transport system permease subunit
MTVGIRSAPAIVAWPDSRNPALALLRAVARHRLAKVGLLIIAVLGIIAIFAPVLAPYDPNHQDLYRVLAPPSRAHLLGTDNLGRDLLSRLLYGARVSLFVGIVSSLVSAALGVVVGLIAGFRGGMVDAIIMRITDAFLCFPPLIFILAMSAALGPGLQNVMLSFALFGWTAFARLVRGQVLLVRELPFIEAARSVGVPATRIMFRHILPNIVAPVLVAITIGIGSAILVESGVSFLGLGVQPPTASWGKELRVGFTYLEAAPLFSIAPGVMISLAIISFNFVGDGLRDALDPRLRGGIRVQR